MRLQVQVAFHPQILGLRVEGDYWHSGPYDEPNAPCGKSVRDGFLHMVRSPEDPDRATPRARRAKMGVGATTEVLRSRKTRSVESALGQVRALLLDGRARTLNSIGVLLWDQTADVLDDRIWQGIVDAVASGEMEHTMMAPILIRARSSRRT